MIIGRAPFLYDRPNPKGHIMGIYHSIVFYFLPFGKQKEVVIDDPEGLFAFFITQKSEPLSGLAFFRF